MPRHQISMQSALPQLLFQLQIPEYLIVPPPKWFWHDIWPRKNLQKYYICYIL